MANIIELIDRYLPTHRTIRIGKTPIEIKGYLTAETFAEIVNTVANSSFAEDGTYHPEYREIAKRYVVIKYLTDIELGEMSAAELFKSTQGGTWYETIVHEAGKLSVWAELEQAIDEAIRECNSLGIKGKETTPFLLAKVKEITGGDSLESNIKLVFNNAEIAAKTACEFSKMNHFVNKKYKNAI